jgi:endonuclease/exonuclease/phosphatase family metal-dependent hydrolase
MKGHSLRRSCRRLFAAGALAALVCGMAAPASAQSSVFVDLPRAHSTVGPDFHIGGWAIDWAARRTTGVMTIHVWAYPADGGPPIFLGVPSRGNRVDVAAAFGQNFLNCGYGLNVRGLAPGDYTIAVFPFSDIRGGFDYNSAVAVPVKVRKPAASPTSAPAPEHAPAPRPSPSPNPEPEPEPSSSGGGSSALRVLHWNIQHGTTNAKVYNLDLQASWIAKADPHVVSLNEVERFTHWGNEDQPKRFAELLKQKTGKTWYYHFASRNGAANAQGNLLLSVYPIESKGSLLLSHNRSVAHIRIIVNGRSVSVFSTHLDHESGSRRATQMEQLKKWAAGFPEQRIIAGDFNTWPTAGEIPRMTGTHFDVWAEAEKAGTAVAFPGNTGQTRNSRIDYIFLSHGASRTTIKGARVFDTRDSRGVMASDHRPLLGIFEVR